MSRAAMDETEIRKYFSDGAREWIAGGYGVLDGYSYPTAENRVRVVAASLGCLL